MLLLLIRDGVTFSANLLDCAMSARNRYPCFYLREHYDLLYSSWYPFIARGIYPADHMYYVHIHSKIPLSICFHRHMFEVNILFCLSFVYFTVLVGALVPFQLSKTGICVEDLRVYKKEPDYLALMVLPSIGVFQQVSVTLNN